MSSIVLIPTNIDPSKLRSINFPFGGAEPRILFVDGTSVFEVNRFSTKYGSWLLCGNLIPQNDLMFLTNYNPIFCLLYLLDDTLLKHKMLLLSDVLTIDGFPGVALLKDCFSEKIISSVCQWKIYDDEIACRLDLAQCLVYLERVHHETLECITEKSKESLLFADKSQLSLHAFDIIADNIGPVLRGKLKAHLNITEKTVGDQAALSAKENIQVQSAKKTKLDSDGNPEAVEDYTKCGVPLTKLSTGGAKKVGSKTKLKKETGQKSVSAFFKK